MEMFLMAFALSMLGVAVSAALFSAATTDVRKPETAAVKVPFIEDAPPQFFAASMPPLAGMRPGVPAEVMLLWLEQHVRVEQAAAESFHLFPTPDSLHTRTISPLVH